MTNEGAAAGHVTSILLSDWLRFEDIRDIDDPQHWADILATKVGWKEEPRFYSSKLKSKCSFRQFLSRVYDLEHTKCLIGVGMVSCIT